MGPALLAAGLVAYNTLANRWRPFHGGVYVPMNLAAAALVLVVGLAVFDLEPGEVGFGWSGWWVGPLVGVAAAVVLGALLARPGTRRILRDRRLEDVRGARALFMIAIRIPLGTAALEELAFRGVLLGALLSAGEATAIAGSSVAFGLWHVAPTLELARANRLRSRPVVYALGGVILTGVAGAALAVLRLETGAVAAPFLAHALVNSLGACAAIAAHRGS